MSARQWLGNAQPAELVGDVQAILAAGRNWSELRDYPRLLQGLLPALFELKQAGLACTIAEAGLAIAPDLPAAHRRATVRQLSQVLQQRT